MNLVLPSDANAAPDMGMLIDALPNPLLVLDEEDRIHLANSAAEDFFQAGKAALLRANFADLMPLASPALNAIAEARHSGGVVNEYAISAGTPRFGSERNIDLQAALVHEQPRFVIVMLLERSMAHKIDRQLTHRNAARSVSGMAAMLAHEIKNPLAGIRGAAQLSSPLCRARTGRWRASSARRPTAFAILSTAWRCSPTNGRPSASRSISMPCSSA